MRTEPIGEIPGTTNQDGTTTSLRPDIRVDGLRDNGITILVNVSITHNHTNQPRPRQGNSVPNDDPIMKRETEKKNKYKVTATATQLSSVQGASLYHSD